MCLSIPAKIIEIDGLLAKASIGGTVLEIGLHLVEDVRVGDYVLVHTGFALEKINKDEAQRMLQIIKDLNENSSL